MHGTNDHDLMTRKSWRGIISSLKDGKLAQAFGAGTSIDVRASSRCADRHEVCQSISGLLPQPAQHCQESYFFLCREVQYEISAAKSKLMSNAHDIAYIIMRQLLPQGLPL